MCVTAPLFCIAGPWASGKSTLALLLSGALPECAVFDFDLLIPAISMAAGKDAFREPSTWPGLHECWLVIAAALTGAGHSMVLCASWEPDDIADLPSRSRLSDVVWAVLDCDDAVLTARLRARDGVTDEEVADELATIRRMRALGVPTFRGDLVPATLASEVAGWVRSEMAARGSATVR